MGNNLVDCNKNQTHLFWTGGWDSTFRLMQLLMVEEKKVSLTLL